MTSQINGVVITHPDKILFPQSEITKEEIAEYYSMIATRMVAYIKDRPVSLKRYPLGINKDGFFQKNITSKTLPSGVNTVSITKMDKKKISMLLCNNAKALVYMANQDSITPHIWLSRYDKPYIPDRIIFDLDTSKDDFVLVKKGAMLLKKVLEEKLQLHTFAMTTGSKGIHVMVPIKREYTFDITRKFAQLVARYLVTNYPDIFTDKQRKNQRSGKLFLDCMRNGYGQTAVAPYAVRAIEKAPIAMPIAWHDLPRITTSQFCTIKNVNRYYNKKDPWNGCKSKSKALVAAEKKLLSLISIAT